jgi:ATP-dependent DNA helicase PIF1
MAACLDATQLKLSMDVLEDSRTCYAILGPAGTGKTVLVRYLVARFLERYDGNLNMVVVAASTGRAASQYDNGVTIQWWALRWTMVKNGDSWRHERFKKYYWRLKIVRVLFIDEISMLSGMYLMELDAMLRYVRGNGAVFGGVKLIVAGDFHQLPPVETLATADQVRDYAFEWKKWRDTFVPIFLQKEYRQLGDPAFRALLTRMREGTMADKDYDLLMGLIDTSMSGPPSDGYVHLYGTNRDVDEYNGQRLSGIPHESHTYSAGFSVEAAPVGVVRKRPSEKPVERTPELEKAFCNIPAKLDFAVKLDSTVILVANLCVADRLCNGARGKVVRFEVDPECGESTLWPVVDFDGGPQGCRIGLWRWTVINADRSKTHCHALPLILGWALTGHRAQGGQWKKVYIGSAARGPGGFYTCITREESMEGVLLRGFSRGDIEMSARVRQFYERGF